MHVCTTWHYDDTHIYLQLLLVNNKSNVSYLFFNFNFHFNISINININITITIINTNLNNDALGLGFWAARDICVNDG